MEVFSPQRNSSDIWTSALAIEHSV